MGKMDDSKLFQLKLTLLEKHSHQHSDLRQKIHLTTERYVTIMLALTALVNSKLTLFSFNVIVQVIAYVLLISAMSSVIFMVLKDNKSSLQHAKIVSRLNEDLGLFSKGKVINHTTLYPSKWKNWGNEKNIKGSILHITIVFVSTVMLIASIVLAN